MALPSSPEDMQTGPRRPPAAGSLGLGDMFEIGVGLMRRHWSTLLLIALIFQMPGAVLTSAAGLGLADTMLDLMPGLATAQTPEQLSLTDADLQRLLASAGLLLAASAVAGAMGAVAMLAYARVVAADHAGDRSSLREAALVALGRMATALAIVLLTSLLVVALTLLAVLAIAALLLASPPDRAAGGGPGVFASLVVGVALILAVVYLSLRWAVALPCAALEAGGPRHALSRSWHMVTSNMWRTAFILGMGALVTSVLGSVLSALASTLLVDPLLAQQGLELAGDLGVAVVVTTLTAPLAPVLTGILYHDLRVRLDGPARTQSTGSPPGYGHGDGGEPQGPPDRGGSA